MHATIEEIRRLADSYLKKEILNDELLHIKRHMSGCDYCYENFCAEYLVRRQLAEKGLVPLELEDNTVKEGMQKIFLVIQEVGRKLKVITQTDGDAAPVWEFLRMPQFAAARSSGEEMQEELFVSRGSEASSIRRLRNRIVIQLDGDIFQTERLAVRVTTGETAEIHSFRYDEETECYVVIIKDEEMTGESVIEIIEIPEEI